MKKETKHITSTFRLPESLYEEMRLRSFKKRISLAEFIRQACDKYIELEDQGEQNDNTKTTERSF